MKLLVWLVAICVAPEILPAQQFDVEPHRAAATQLIQAALRDSFAYKRLARLVDSFGHRMSGSENLERAIDWTVAEMMRDGFDNVHKEPVDVTHLVRCAESAQLLSPRRTQLHLLGLGRSVVTTSMRLRAP